VEITFLSLVEVIAIHEEQIRRFGGSFGITAEQETYADFVIDIAASRREKKDALEFFRRHAVQMRERQ